MRCLSVAEFLRSQGDSCLFICRNHSGNRIEHIKSKGFDVLVLCEPHAQKEKVRNDERSLRHAAWLPVNWETDARQTRSLLQKRSVDWLVVDHYALDERWESEMRPLCERILAIDDLADRHHDCDLLLDQSNHELPTSRYDAITPPGCIHLLGPEFCLLQAEYAELHPVARLREGQINRVLVYFGGADVENFTGRILDALLFDFEQVHFDIVVDQNHQSLKDICAAADGRPNTSLHVAIPTLAKLIMKADLAIGAAGTTSWERCCLALPTIAISIAENQKLVAKQLHAGGFVNWLGDAGKLSIDEVLGPIKETLYSGISKAWSKRCWELVDGRGVERLAFFLTAGPESELEVRQATADDESRILEWANDPIVRQNAFNESEITKEGHTNWFRDVLTTPEKRKVFIVESRVGIPIGYVRFDHKDAGWEISYALDGKFRGLGLGRKLVWKGISRLQQDIKKTPVFGRVKPSNVQSIKVFEGLEFRRIDGDERWLTFVSDS